MRNTTLIQQLAGMDLNADVLVQIEGDTYRVYHANLVVTPGATPDRKIYLNCALMDRKIRTEERQWEAEDLIQAQLLLSMANQATMTETDGSAGFDDMLQPRLDDKVIHAEHCAWYPVESARFEGWISPNVDGNFDLTDIDPR